MYKQIFMLKIAGCVAGAFAKTIVAPLERIKILLQVKGTTEEQSHDARDKTSEKFEFVAHKKGVHKFCFTNKSPYHETLDFDIHVGHFTYFELYAKDEHFNPLLEQISKLKEALYNIQLEQHWLEATTDR